MSDLISRNALINKFEQWQKQDGYDNGEWNLLVDVITEIKNMPLATDINVGTKDGTNCISREQAIEAVRMVIGDNRSISVCDAIKQLPPIQPKRMKAKWIATTALQEGQITWRDYKCSNCSHHRGKPMNYCEVCGAKMER